MSESFLEDAYTLFIEYRESFGLPDELEEQCEFEDKFAELFCMWIDHQLISDQCGIPAHDYCTMCGHRREVIDGGVNTNHDGMPVEKLAKL